MWVFAFSVSSPSSCGSVRTGNSFFRPVLGSESVSREDGSLTASAAAPIQAELRGRTRRGLRQRLCSKGLTRRSRKAGRWARRRAVSSSGRRRLHAAARTRDWLGIPVRISHGGSQAGQCRVPSMMTSMRDTFFMMNGMGQRTQEIIHVNFGFPRVQAGDY